MKKNKLSNVIKHLQIIKEEEGDISVVVRVDHDYWGSVDSYAVIGVSNGQPEGPKSGKSEKCVIISSY